MNKTIIPGTNLFERIMPELRGFFNVPELEVVFDDSVESLTEKQIAGLEVEKYYCGLFHQSYHFSCLTSKGVKTFEYRVEVSLEMGGDAKEYISFREVEPPVLE